jgi:hypothetical protein
MSIVKRRIYPAGPAVSFRADKLPPQAKGDEIWGEAVGQRLARLMK